MADDEQPEDRMIEIGDPTEEPAQGGSPAAPRVVIEYRDRGVPWMLVPPLLVLAAVVAVIVAPAFRPQRERIVVRAAEKPGPVPPSTPVPAPIAVAEALKPEPAPVPPPVVAEAAPAPADIPLAEPVQAPAPFPRGQGVGFDVDALRSDARPEAPVDPAVGAAAQDPPRDEPAAPAPALPGAVDQPAEVNPDVLPPDPRLALQLRMERVIEARRKAERDRAEFHAELAAICRRQGNRSAAAIHELCLKYGDEVDPVIKQQVARMLGPSGIAAGVGRPVRINLLRSQGFPEVAILMDIFTQDIRWVSEEKKGLSKAVRGGPRSMDEALYSAALVLLNNPPRRVAGAATGRPVSSGRPGPGNRANPDGPATNLLTAPPTAR